MMVLLTELKRFLKTVLCFTAAVFLIPILIISFIGVYYTDAIVNYVLSIKYPDLTISKSKKIRTLIDTPRNAGIFHFLLKLKGQCDLDIIRERYAEHLTENRDKAGVLRFPRLRQKLVSCWGHYAWVNDMSSFNLNNHIVMSPRTYRGRPVNDSNIEEFVSDLVTKYIPSDLPQWQVIVIPNFQGTSSISVDTNESSELIADEHYYILVKVHHLLLAEEEDLHISELLMLHENSRKQIIDIDDDMANERELEKHSSYFIHKPVHIQRLLHHIRQQIINRWNAFVYEYESLDTPDGDEYRRLHIGNITQLLSVLLIIVVNVCCEYWRTIKRSRRRLSQMPRVKRHKISSYGVLTNLLKTEFAQRNLSWEVAGRALYSSCMPSNLVKSWTMLLWELNVNKLLLLPYHSYNELCALCELILRGQTSLTGTYCRRLWIYLPMLIYAQLEFLKICYEIFKAPANIYDELFKNRNHEPNILHMKSYSGRKIISFSKSIDISELRARIPFNDELRESDFVLSCLAGAIYDYFKCHEKYMKVPSMLNTTCRTIAKGYFTESSGDKLDNIGGIVLLRLPLKLPDRDHVQQLHSVVENIRRNQIMIYLASLGQTRYNLFTSLLPRVITKIFINFFAYNFPVTITEIHGTTSSFQSVLESTVEDVMLFRPPQSKTCLSLNIHRFENKYRLAIMADTQLGPDHAKIARSFEKYMETATL